MMKDLLMPSVDTERAALGEERFSFVFAEGRTMTLERAIAYALEENVSA